MDKSLLPENRNILTGSQKISVTRMALYLMASLVTSMQMTTQYVAYTFDYQASLGWSIRGFYAPWSVVVWYLDWHQDYPDEFELAVAMLLVSTMVGLAVLISLEGEKNKMRHLNHTLHGSSRFAKRSDLVTQDLLHDDPPIDSVVIGAWKDEFDKILYLRQSRGHVKCIAQTGAGKGVSLVVPTLLSWGHSALICDVKGELWSLTAGWRARQAKNKVVRFEPCSGRYARWNPLNEIRLGTDHEYVDVMVLVRVMLDPNGGVDKSSYWYNAARNLLVGVILHVLYTGRSEGREVTLLDVDMALSDPEKDSSELWSEMRSNRHCAGRRHRGVAAVGRDMLSKAEEELSGVLSSAQAATEPYRNPLVAYSVSTSDFHLKDLMNGPVPMSVYLVLPPGDIPEAIPILRILINMNIRKTTPPMEYSRNKLKVASGWVRRLFVSTLGKLMPGRFVAKEVERVSSVKAYNYRLLTLLDEFAALGRLDELQRSIAYVASFGVMYYIILQDDGQLRSTETGYGRNESITGNCRTRIAFNPGNDEEVTALSKMAGMTTAYRANVTYSRQNGTKGSKSVSYTEAPRPLLNEDEVRSMPNLIVQQDGEVSQMGSMLIRVVGCPVIYGTVVPYLSDPTFSRRAGQYVPDVGVYHPHGRASDSQISDMSVVVK